MKKNNVTVIAVVSFLLLFFGLSFVLTSEKEKKEAALEVSKWVEAVESGEFVVTVLGSSTCPHCQNYKPVITKLAKEEGFKFFFYELDNLSSDDKAIVTDTFTLENFEGAVPYTFVVKNNEFINDVTGGKEEEDLITFLEESGYKFEN